MRIPIFLWRALRVSEHLITGAMIAAGIAAGRRLSRRLAWVPAAVRWWYRRLCRALGIQIEVIGSPASNTLLVANHISWLDIPVLGAQAQMDFLAKTEVRDWPLIGWMSEIAGTLFVTRGANGTAPLIPRIAARLRQDGRLAVFPEGTTTDGSRLRRFRPRLLAVAQDPGVRVQPVALRYGCNRAPDRIAPFIGDDALLPHLLRLIRHPGLQIRVHFLLPIDASELSRRRIAEHCQRAIAETLDLETSATAPAITRPVSHPPPPQAAAA